MYVHTRYFILCRWLDIVGARLLDLSSMFLVINAWVFFLGGVSFSLQTLINIWTWKFKFMQLCNQTISWKSIKRNLTEISPLIFLDGVLPFFGINDLPFFNVMWAEHHNKTCVDINYLPRLYQKLTKMLSIQFIFNFFFSLPIGTNMNKFLSELFPPSAHQKP